MDQSNLSYCLASGAEGDHLSVTLISAGLEKFDFVWLVDLDVVDRLGLDRRAADTDRSLWHRLHSLFDDDVAAC